MAHVEPLREDDPPAVGTYRLLGRLGAGGQGTVYLGQGPDGRAVAVKVLREGTGFDERFAKEIAAARRVEPFCIAQVLDASLGAQPYIVTEYVEGPSLQQAGRHSGAGLQRLAVATATALAAIHEAGIVHRDFKPANVLLGPGGPRVIDFGIARALDEAVTHTSGIVGTPAYMAPEQLGGHQVGPQADVFAWASVMVWAGTGTPPFGQDTLPAIINRILNNEPQLGDLPHPMRSIVYDCLAKDPRNRPTMRDVILRLLSGQNPMPGQGYMSGPGQGPGTGPGTGPMPGQGPMPGPGMRPMPGQGPGPMPGRGPMPGQGPMPGRRAGGRRVGLPVAVSVSVSGIMVAALVAGAVWFSSNPGDPTTATLALTSPSPSTTKSTKGTKATTSPKSTKPTKKPTTRPTTAKPTTPKTTAASTPTPARTTKRPSPTPVRTTKKPVVSARAGILEIEMKGGPGQEQGSGCYMPPVGFQTYVETTKREIWVSSAWILDGKSLGQRKNWVSADVYTAFVSSGQYMLKAGRHSLTLKVTSPSVTQKTLNFNVCAMPTW